MNKKVLSNVFLAAMLGLVAPNVFALTVIGGTLVEGNQVAAVTVGSTSEGEAYGVYVVAVVGGVDLSDNSCLALPPDYAVAGCSTEARAAAPTPGVQYCGSGSGMPTVTGGIPHFGEARNWGPDCETYRPPGSTNVSQATLLGCVQACARWNFSYAASYANTYRIQTRPLVGGSWSTYTVTGNISVVAHLGQNPKQWRIRGENGHGVGPWSSTFYTTGECGGGGGGGGPID